MPTVRYPSCRPCLTNLSDISSEPPLSTFLEAASDSGLSYTHHRGIWRGRQEFCPGQDATLLTASAASPNTPGPFSLPRLACDLFVRSSTLSWLRYRRRRADVATAFVSSSHVLARHTLVCDSQNLRSPSCICMPAV